jgi:hypothetical protein
MGPQTTGERADAGRYTARRGGLSIRRKAMAVIAATPLLAVLVGVGAPTVAMADSTPMVVVNDVTMPRPTSGTATFAFTISITHSSNATVYVNYYTSDGSARSTFDYQPVSGTATFAPGKTTVTVNVLVNGTTLHTGDRYFYVYLNNAVHAVVQKNGLGTIIDTTMLPYLNVSDATVTQGAGTSNTATFNITLTAPSANKVRVHYYTSNGAAAAGIDYTSQSGFLTFAPLATSAQVNVPVTGFGIYQTVKYFYLNINSPQNAAIGHATGQATILNNNHIAYVTSDEMTIPEPASGTSTVMVPVRVTPTSNFPVTVAFATSNGSAVAGTDYNTASGTLTIPANVAQVTVPVTIKASGLTSLKYFAFSIGSPSAGATILRTTSYVVISVGTYNQLSVGDIGFLAPTSGTMTATFTVTLSPSSGSTVGVNYQTSDGSALQGTHYNAAAGTLSFAPGVTTKTVSVTIKADPTQFSDVYFFLNLNTQTPAGIVIQRSSANAYIETSAFSPMISVASGTITKPASGTITEPFTVTLSAASSNTVSVNYSTSNGSAVAGTDYTPANGTLTFTAGVTTQTVNVTITGGTLASGDLYFYVNLATPVNAVIASYQGIGYIQSPNHNPNLAINTIAVYKARSGTVNANLTVTLSSSSPNTVTVNFGTQNGSATAPTDYTATTGILTFAPGVTSQSISVPTVGNTLPTGDRYFYVNLSSNVNAGVTSGQGLVDIIDSSIVPYLSVGATSVQKPSSGTANATFTVTLSPASPNTVTVNYTTNSGSAVAGVDFTSAAATLTFAPGLSTQTVNVTVLASTLHTGDLYFTLNLNTPANAILGQYYNYATIIDPTSNPNLTVDDTGVSRPSSGTVIENFKVRLTPASSNTVTVNFGTQDGSATTGAGDYVANSGTLTFNPGDTSKTIAVTVNGSATSGPDRYMYMNINTPTHAQIAGRSQAYGLIIDTVLPTSGTSYFTVQDAEVLKPNSGTATDSFNVNLFPAANTPVNVNYATTDGNAIAGMGDYVAARGTLTFAAGITTQSVPVTVNGSTMPTADKYFQLSLGSNTGPTSIFRTSSYGFILNQQPDSRLTVGPDITINRGTSGSQVINFSVSLSSPQQFPVQVDYTTNDGSAVAPDGYLPEVGTLVFAPGVTTQSVAVTVPGSAAYTTVQYFFFDISNPINSTTAWSRETAYVYNLDTFAITGKVIDQNAAGIAGVTITRSGCNLAARATTTAGDGTFSILNNINCVYTLTPTLAGETFLPATLSATVRGASLATSSFLGYAGVGITGIAVDAAGKAKAGITITRSGGGQANATTTTDTLGYYAFGNVPAGSAYVVTPTLTNFSFNPANYTFNVAATTVKNQDFVALQGVTISGQVTFAGAGVAGVTITRTGGGQPTVTTTTNSQGYYGFSNNPATVGGVTYTITPTKTGKTFSPTSLPATVTTTSNATGINFTQN